MKKLIPYSIIAISSLMLSLHYISLQKIKKSTISLNQQAISIDKEVVDINFERLIAQEEDNYEKDIELTQNYAEGYNANNGNSETFKQASRSTAIDITKILDKNVKIEVREDRMQNVCDVLTLMAKAKQNNDFIKVLEEKKDEITWYQNLSPLHCAAEGDNLELLKYILKNNPYASINKLSQNGNLAIHYAAIYNDPELIEFLLKEGSQGQISNNYGNSPLYIAIAHGNLDVIKIMAKYNVDILDKSGYSQARIMTNSTYPDFDYFYSDKIANNDMVNYPVRMFPTTTLHIATKFNHANILAYLLENGANINASDYYDLRILHYAIIMNNYDLVKFIIANKADINTHDKMGNTALHFATDEHVDTKILELLLNNKANPNIQNKNGDTALSHAITEGNQEKAMLLQTAVEKYELMQQLQTE